MYSIDKLIQQCGRQNAMSILPRLFIKINTSSAEEKKAILEYEYDGVFSLSSFTITNILIQELIQKNVQNNKHLTNMLNDLLSFVSLFYDCRNRIDVSDVDYIVVSYLGDFQLRFKNTSSIDKPYGNALYLDIQALRIELIDEQTMQIWKRNYMVFRNGVKIIGCYILFKYVANFMGYNWDWNFRKMIGM
jgi:hypothetical protein